MRYLTIWATMYIITRFNKNHFFSTTQWRTWDFIDPGSHLVIAFTVAVRTYVCVRSFSVSLVRKIPLCLWIEVGIGIKLNFIIILYLHNTHIIIISQNEGDTEICYYLICFIHLKNLIRPLILLRKRVPPKKYVYLKVYNITIL